MLGMAATDGAAAADNGAAADSGSSNAETPHIVAQSHITALPTAASSTGSAATAPIDPASKYPDLPPSHAALLASLPLVPPPLPPPPPPPPPSFDASTIEYVSYTSEHQLPYIQSLIDRDLSEPYSIYTYRYFINNWPHLALLALVHTPNDHSSNDASQPAAANTTHCVGTIVCKLSPPAQPTSSASLSRGYLAMLATHHHYRHMGIALQLVQRVMAVMERDGADVMVLETEVSNAAALSLYERLHFVRDCRLPRYYLNGGDAYRLKRWLTGREQREQRAERERKEMEEREAKRRGLSRDKAGEMLEADGMHQLTEQADRLSVEQDLYDEQQEESDEDV